MNILYLFENPLFNKKKEPNVYYITIFTIVFTTRFFAAVAERVQRLNKE